MRFKNSIFKFTIYSIIVLTLFSNNKPKNGYDNSILWEINKPEGGHISYILGTIHALDTTNINFPRNKFRNLMDKCKTLCLEVIPEKTNGMNRLSKYLYMSDENLKISKRLEKNHYNKLIQLVDSSKHLLKMSKPYLDSMRPTILSFYIEMEKQFRDAEKSKAINYFPEADFQKYAVENNYEIIQLEKAQEQIDWVVKPDLSFEKSLELLEKSIDNFKDKDSEIDVVKRYKEQNLALSQGELLKDSILILRNTRMANKIDSIIKIKSLFIAIGAGHLPHKIGVLNLLAQKGYTIKPLKIDLRKK